MNSLVIPGVLVVGAFALLLATFLSVRYLDERAQKWVGLLLFVDVATWLLTIGSLITAWSMVGQRALQGARNAMDIVRNRVPSAP